MPVRNLSRQQYENAFQAELDEMSSQIDDLTASRGDEQGVGELRKDEEDARSKLQALRASSDDNWENAKKDLLKSYGDLNRKITRCR